MNEQPQLATGATGLVEQLPGKTAHDFGVRFIRTGEGNKGYYEDMRGKLARISSISENVVNKGGAMSGWAAKVCGLWLERNLPQVMRSWHDGDPATHQDNIKLRPPNKIELADLVRRMKSEYRYTKEEAADIGTWVHTWIQAYVRGLKQKFPDHVLARQACEAFMEWAAGRNTMRGYDLKPRATEVMLYHPELRIAGTCDAIFTHVPVGTAGASSPSAPPQAALDLAEKEALGAPELWANRDWKTASGAYVEQLLQSVLYALCMEAMWGVTVGSVGAVVCTKQGQLILTYADHELTDRDRKAAEYAVYVASYTTPDLWKGPR